MTPSELDAIETAIRNGIDTDDRQTMTENHEAHAGVTALVARVRELEAERDERTRQHAARGVEAVAVIDELRLTLLNERGEGAGPSEGWTWDGNSSSWLHGLDANGEYPDDGWTVDKTPAGQYLGWTWEHRGTQSDPYPYARAAMRAADLARAGGAK